jgi:uncharacterized protein YwqG
MTKKVLISFQKEDKPITQAVTKFGGRPSWIENAEWPISRSTEKPMRFICQINLEKDVFDDLGGRMAYIFMTDDDDYVDGTWEPNGAENAVVIQPGGNNPPSTSLGNGPTLYEMKEVEGLERLQPFDCEFSVVQSSVAKETEIDSDEFGNKIGGLPNFLQFEEFPDDKKENWNLVLQLDSTCVPFYLNFGDSGVGYAFISTDGKTGKFLWQCT